MGLHVLVYLQIYNRMKPKFLALINKTSNTSVVQGPKDVSVNPQIFSIVNTTASSYYLSMISTILLLSSSLMPASLARAAP